jgi:dolichol-phosphate mannosyltransferase
MIKTFYFRIKTYIFQKIKSPAIIGKFLLVSGSAVVLNILLLFLLVNNLGFNSNLGENIANILSMEVSIVYNFFLSRKITWGDREKEFGKNLWFQVFKFHMTIGITIVFRIVLFYILQLLNIFYLLNAAIGIAISALFNFTVYDTIIFKNKME